MKHNFLSFCLTALLLLFGQSLFAHDFYVDGIYYTYLSQTDKTVSVSYRGTYYYQYPTKYSGNVVIPASVTYNGTTYSVTSIGEYAFSVCTGLTSIEIPSGVTSIGYEAFKGCTGLTSIEIPSGVTSIGVSAFCGCTGLTSIVVASGNSVYDSRNNCNAIIETASNTLITGCQNTVIPSGVTCIGDNAFYSCTGLTSIEIPSSVTSIGWSAFSHCTGLTSVKIPDSVTSIGDWAFWDCTSLAAIYIPKGSREKFEELLPEYKAKLVER